MTISILPGDQATLTTMANDGQFMTSYSHLTVALKNILVSSGNHTAMLTGGLDFQHGDFY